MKAAKAAGSRERMPLSVPGSTVPKPKIAAVERRKACALGSSARCRVCQSAAEVEERRLSALRSLGFSGWAEWEYTRANTNPRVFARGDDPARHAAERD